MRSINKNNSFPIYKNVNLCKAWSVAKVILNCFLEYSFSEI